MANEQQYRSSYTGKQIDSAAACFPVGNGQVKNTEKQIGITGSITNSGSGNVYSGYAIGYNTGSITSSGNGNFFLGSSITTSVSFSRSSSSALSTRQTAIAKTAGLTVEADGVFIMGHGHTSCATEPSYIDTDGMFVIGRYADLSLDANAESAAVSEDVVIDFENPENSTVRALDGGNDAILIVGCGSGPTVSASTASSEGDLAAQIDYDNVSANAAVLHMDGSFWVAGANKNSGSDYAEYIREWGDGNPEAEDRCGLFVTIKNDKLELAENGDYIAGIISGNPSVVGGSLGDQYWTGSVERDVFNRPVKEMVYEVDWVSDKSDNIRVLNEPEEPEELEKKEARYICRPKKRLNRNKLSTRYNVEQKSSYIKRANRPEWDIVGLIGVLPVRDDGTCIPGQYCKCGGKGMATAAAERGFDTYFVLSRKQETEDHDYGVVEILLK